MGVTETAYLGLGSSLGDRARNIREALHVLSEIGSGLEVVAVSPVYESPHMGLAPGDEDRFPPHLNCVARIATTLSPDALLARAHAAEEAGRRRRDRKWGPRTIDIDILVYGDRVINSERLTIPHPGIAGRAFVVMPLADLAPDLVLPNGAAVADLRHSERIRSQRIQRVADDELFLRGC